MLLNLQLQRHTHVDPSPNVAAVAAMFGLGLDDQPPRTIIPPIQLHLAPGKLVFITGPSGSGKSSILKLLADALFARADAFPIRFEDLPPLPDAPLVDLFPDRSLNHTLRLLTLAGLGDAFIMLRKPSELSDGQRYRLNLAHALAVADEAPPTSLKVLIADEFAAPLDRTTAKVLARNLRRWTRKHAHATPAGLCAVVATTHDDILESLQPDLLIEKPLDQSIQLLHAPSPLGRGLG